MRRQRILFLYNEVMGYLLAGIHSFHLQHPDIEIHLFENDEKKLTPFHFQVNYIKYYKKSAFNKWDVFQDKCTEINPDLLIVSGRMNSHYLKIAKQFKKKIYTVSIQDTQFDNSLRTKFKCILSSILYKQYFDGIWTVGQYGVLLATKLGYSKKNIYNNALSADDRIFNISNQENLFSRDKVIVYVGRFAKEKNLHNFVNVFDEVNKRHNNSWKLLLIGNGDNPFSNLLTNNFEIHPFQQPESLVRLVEHATVFCLPSYFEPWGLVVHEMAKLGKILLISNKCGSISEFLIDGFNGLSFNPHNIFDWKEKMDYIFSLNEDEKIRYRVNSISLSKRITSEIWAAQLFSIFSNNLGNK